MLLSDVYAIFFYSSGKSIAYTPKRIYLKEKSTLNGLHNNLKDYNVM